MLFIQLVLVNPKDRVNGLDSVSNLLQSTCTVQWIVIIVQSNYVPSLALENARPASRPASLFLFSKVESWGCLDYLIYKCSFCFCAMDDVCWWFLALCCVIEWMVRSYDCSGARSTAAVRRWWPTSSPRRRRVGSATSHLHHHRRRHGSASDSNIKGECSRVL